MADIADIRRLETPERVSSRRSAETRRRSRSRTRRGDSPRRYRSRSRLRERSSTRDRDRLRERERHLERERVRLRDLEDEVRRNRSRLRSTERRERERDYRSSSGRASQQRARGSENLENEQQRLVERNIEADAQAPKRSDINSPSFSTNDIVKLLNALKESRPQTSTSGAPIYTNNVNHKNILPDFDPSSKNQRVDIWLKKVNECATVYGWDDKTTIHFAMQKLQRLAKVWYEGLNSILFTWVEWQEKLLKAFPCEQNYGQSLEEMLKRKSRCSEPIEVYYYDKLALLNQCDIDGKRAVECIIHGLSDKTLKSSALALRCSHPDLLLRFLISNKETSQFSDRSSYKNKTDSNSDTNTNSQTNKGDRNVNPQGDTVVCFNCKEVGHSFLKCPKPLIRCSQCSRVGHKAENCRVKADSQSNKDDK